ncbi:thioredoxin-like protein [Crassisporium funariophilum]|nr:thioredoxin-like protein [Crassisporium funariophilum]
MVVRVIATLEDFQAIVNRSKPSIIYFYESWSDPCKFISPKFEQLSTVMAYHGFLEFYEVDLGKRPDIANTCRVTIAPTFAVYKSGKSVSGITGSDSRALREYLQRVVGNKT